jgi:transposase
MCASDSGGKRGEHNQAIGRSRGGRTTKIHALSDPLCRPVVLHLTPGQDSDIATAPVVLALAPPMSALLGDKGYDGDDFRGEIVRRGATPVIPNKSNRGVIHRFNKRAYKARMSSSAASAGSKTSGASPPDTTSSPAISWPLFISPLSSLIGSIESGP